MEKHSSPHLQVNRNPHSISSRNSNSCLGIRRRPSERYAVEFRNTHTGEKYWLGTFDTIEEAIFAYDSFISFCGVENARTNIIYLFNDLTSPPPPPPPSPSEEASRQNYGEICWMEEKEFVDEESELIAVILQSFTHSNELERMMTL